MTPWFCVLRLLNSALVVISLTLAACSSKQEASAPTAIVTSVPYDYSTFNVVVGKRYHVQEGALDAEVASDLTTYRQVSKFSGIQDALDDPSYRHYGNADELKPPLCKVIDQDTHGVETDTLIDYGTFDGPVTCTLADGTTMYATAMIP